MAGAGWTFLSDNEATGRNAHRTYWWESIRRAYAVPLAFHSRDTDFLTSPGETAFSQRRVEMRPTNLRNSSALGRRAIPCKPVDPESLLR